MCDDLGFNWMEKVLKTMIAIYFLLFRSTAIATSSAAARIGSFSASYIIWLVSYYLIFKKRIYLYVITMVYRAMYQRFREKLFNEI